MPWDASEANVGPLNEARMATFGRLNRGRRALELNGTKLTHHRLLRFV